MRRSGSPVPNGGSPVASSYSVAPSAYRSARWSTGRPVRPVCSGARYASVPTISLWWVNSGRISATDVASSKSTRQGAPSPDDHDVGRADVAVHHPPPVHPGHGPRQRHRQPDQLIDRQRLHQRRQARAADVRQHDRVRIPRRIHQLRDPVHPAQPLEHRPLMLQPPRPRPAPAAPYGSPSAPAGTAGSPACARSRAGSRSEPADRRPATPRPHPPCTSTRVEPLLCLHPFSCAGDHTSGPPPQPPRPTEGPHACGPGGCGA